MTNEAIEKQDIQKVRKDLSNKYLHGNGIEIGALHRPLWVNEKAAVKYVDRLDNPGLKSHYPELDQYELTRVDIIDDGERLLTIQNDSLDFIIANHMLEHCENPIGTIRNHLAKLTNNGVLYYAVPDKRHTFDAGRELTDFKHLVNDDKKGIADDNLRRKHFFEFANAVYKDKPLSEREEATKKFLDMNYSIHFHVWDALTFKEFVTKSRIYLNNSFEILELQENGEEIITILRKQKNGKLQSILRKLLRFFN
ncbi:MAG: Methyltransferase type 11 [Candidatus Moranbacteria bacterium GW2011_GWC1_45_18]|nr:MAG: Methyltransferase type 11 [Candidatus Moranbacteria bacterium GW2011_GWC2_40_12]KKT32678.1 MAG: Methyltransferase type 11 [Candidatus Moranbacteria bacterium GW2011_GWF2_44_10]KKT69544.1 MAG: Methyltransferase type 11 [Candidatus Moranbacteria bacterium GW2011_GWF1_44_4]KKU00160.1 MAG: Methyltransferase type 11 [Candidatus Moranbacteria bacterium GW2011_GWC1_45_18]OGI35221.1 MAG: hypothetical protein A2407_00690 [Candidatus Moranbacteria bacterium RIFOXYC1_FULL_44_8]OGI39402.1 MAG: hyp